MKDIPESLKELVIVRIETQVPSHLKLSIGSQGSLNKKEMIEHVRNGDEIGHQIVAAHLEPIPLDL